MLAYLCILIFKKALKLKLKAAYNLHKIKMYSIKNTATIINISFSFNVI